MAAPRNPVRIGVIGFGQWGPNHVRNLLHIDGCEVAAVCDSRTERMELVQRMFRGTATTTNVDDLFNDPSIDALVVATPVATHFELVQRALQAGKDVLCEKPLAATIDESERLQKIANERERILMVGHVFLYNAAVRFLKADLDAGMLGRVHYLDAVRTNLGPIRPDVGAIHDLASHDISIFNHLLDAQPLTVSATGAAYLQPGIEDIGFLTLTYPNKVICHVHTSWLNPRKVRQLTIVGDGKMAVWDDMNNLEPIRYYDKGVTADHYRSFGEFHMILRDGAIMIPKVRLHEPLAHQDEAFVQSVRDRKPPAADARFAIGVVRVLEAAQTSLREQGKAVPVAST